jgi:hypothetical protein
MISSAVILYPGTGQIPGSARESTLEQSLAGSGSVRKVLSCAIKLPCIINKCAALYRRNVVWKLAPISLENCKPAREQRDDC